MRWIAAALSIVLTPPAFAGGVSVAGARLWAAPDHTRVVFPVSGPVDHSLFTLKHPDRVVLDLKNARRAPGFASPRAPEGVVTRVRSAPRHGTDLRVVLEVKSAVRPRSFLLSPSPPYGYRLVVDLYNGPARPARAVITAPKRGGAPRDVIVAVDAGHGGEDPGARGPGGTEEKNVTLAIARKLAALIDRQPGMRAVMTRTGDYYIGLRERMDMARRAKADLFISLHADAYRNRQARGASVYILSQRGASSEAARWLARSENASDRVGGVDLEDKGHMLASVLLDLSQSATLEASMQAARDVLGQLEQVGRVHRRRVEQAGFMVLKSPDVPSMLVETAFISNPREERELRSPRYQMRIARAVLHGIRRYFVQRAPSGTRFANREHVITPGETLSVIAQRYQVTIQRLRVANGLNNDQVQVGEVLRIPIGGDG
ncbi:MAG: N-acetylmuramoyl-L-alanine amidase [Chromatiales bacterium 21-64-14]|nr:MAG: N-acetylmuramoyl-L-alanine amidase [Chromatiales bacterium 21-64-14]HQU14742.1 N-acetylmuramoyl-L-alanine amidase [Gammaproteobacteria bacterium]